MSKGIEITTVIVAAFAITVMAALVSQSSPNEAPADAHYMPQYTKSGEMILPPDNIWREWVYVGSPLTPNALSDGKVSFPEYHNVYIQLWAYATYKRTNQFPDGTILFKELQLTLGPAQYPDGSRTEQSGRGYFPGAFNGADVTVKDTKRFAATGGWGYFDFNYHEPKAPTAKVEPRDQCAFCHIACAKQGRGLDAVLSNAG
jgi:hypothetical protein